jgi:hypothetical protein
MDRNANQVVERNEFRELALAMVLLVLLAVSIL